jgi:sucrose-6-phosphate hydrolase SacC (GH32 family)
MKNGKLIQKPYKIEKYFKKEIKNIDEINLDNANYIDVKDFSYLKIDGDGFYIEMIYKEGTLILNRTNEIVHSRLFDSGKEYKLRLSIDLIIDNISIIYDRSSLEIYINDGQEVLTTRFLIGQNRKIHIDGNIDKIYELINIIIRGDIYE